MNPHPDLTRRAAHILRDLGLPAAVLTPVDSYSSAVWLTPDYFVHYHLIGPAGRLEHAARVATRLAPEALFPEVLAVGYDAGHDWLVTKRVPGIVLSAAWPWLTRAERRDAIHQAAASRRAVHAAPAHGVVPPCLLEGVPVVTRHALAARLRTCGLPSRYDPLLVVADAPTVMAHGDFHFNQILWHRGRVTALLDLEMAHVEARGWDLGPFLTACLDPPQMVPERLGALPRPRRITPSHNIVDTYGSFVGVSLALGELVQAFVRSVPYVSTFIVFSNGSATTFSGTALRTGAAMPPNPHAKPSHGAVACALSAVYESIVRHSQSLHPHSC